MKFRDIFDVKELADMDESNPEYAAGAKISNQFTIMVDGMRNANKLALPKINNLMSLFWQLVGNRITPMAVTAVPTLSFAAEYRGDSTIGMVLVPPNWLELIAKDAYCQMGALIFVASQSKDYWNCKFNRGSEKEIKARAYAYEAEFLLFLKEYASDFTVNEYQKTVLEKYPRGILSEPSSYEGRKYDRNVPPFPLDIDKL